MNLVDIIGWVGVVLVLVAYGLSTRRGPRIFDWANALLWPPCALPSFVYGAYSAAAISVTFGLIGTWRVWRTR